MFCHNAYPLDLGSAATEGDVVFPICRQGSIASGVMDPVKRMLRPPPLDVQRQTVLAYRDL